MEFIADFNKFFRVTNIQLAMRLDDFLNSENENNGHESMTDKQIIETVQQVKDDHDEGELDPPSPHLNLPK